MTDDRACVLGCTVKDVHYATCAWFGIETVAMPAVAALPNTPEVCRGCAPAVARDGALICDRCFRQFRWMLNNAPDLLGRLRSLADPTRAAPIERARSSSASSPPAPSSELIDATDDVMRTLRSWSGGSSGMPAGTGAVSASRLAHECVWLILEDFDRIANTAAEVVQLAEGVIVRHPVDADGVRSFWSIVDAVDRYRIERPDDRTTYVDPSADDGIVSVWPIPEPTGSPLIVRAEALRLADVSDSTLRRWVSSGDVHPVRYGNGGRVTYFRPDEIEEVARRMSQRAEESRFTKNTNHTDGGTP